MHLIAMTTTSNSPETFLLFPFLLVCFHLTLDQIFGWLVGGSRPFWCPKVFWLLHFEVFQQTFFAWKNIRKSLKKSFLVVFLLCISWQGREKALWLVVALKKTPTSKKSKSCMHFPCCFWLVYLFNNFYFKNQSSALFFTDWFLLAFEWCLQDLASHNTCHHEAPFGFQSGTAMLSAHGRLLQSCCRGSIFHCSHMY